MKILKSIGWFAILLLLSLLLAALFAPRENSFENNTTIEAPAEIVLPLIADLNNWEKWDPWFQQDRAQFRSVSPYNNSRESSLNWTSKKGKLGRGKVVLTQLDSLTYKFRIEPKTKYWSKHATGSIIINEVKESTSINWVVSSRLNYPLNFLHYFTNKWFGEQYKNGLTTLKQIAEE